MVSTTMLFEINYYQNKSYVTIESWYDHETDCNYWHGLKKFMIDPFNERFLSRHKICVYLKKFLPDKIK